MKQRLTAFIIFFSTIVNFNSFAQWRLTPLNNQYIWSFAIVDTCVFAGSSGGGVYLSTNNGTSWSEMDSGLTNMGISALTTIPNGSGGTIIFAGTFGSGVFKSTNLGKSWDSTALGKEDVWALAASGTNIFAGTQNGMYISANQGASWSEINSGFTNPAAPIVNTLLINGQDVLAGTTGGIFLSTDNGTKWTASSSGLPNTDVWALSKYSSKIFAGTSLGLYVSTNGGSSWILTPLANQNVWALASKDTMLFAATRDSGVYISTDTGAAWVTIDSGLADFNISSLAVNDSNIFAGALGVYVLPFNLIFAVPTGIKQLDSKIPNDFALSQNYPNPFNPTTTINFSVRKESFVSIKVYDALGREIATLVNEQKPTGNYKVDFNGSGLASGIYFYRMSAGNFTGIKKLVLLK